MAGVTDGSNGCAGRPFKEHRRGLLIVPTLPRGNASTDALRSALEGTQSVPGCIPTQSVGTIIVSLTLSIAILTR